MKLSINQRKALLKRSADFLEKFSIASLAVGVFQAETLGFMLGLIALILSVLVTLYEA